MLKKLVLGTKNEGKVRELRALLSGIQVEGLPASAADVVEDGRTYRENALKKAQAYQKLVCVPVLADDSGLEVEALGGQPGVFSARYGGAELTWPQRWEYLIQQLQSFPQENWTACFRCVLCYVDGKNGPVFFEGIAPGRILPQPRGKGGFGYDPIVFSEDLKMSFAEAPEKDKNRVSHRAKALKAFRSWLDQGGGRS